MSRLAVSFAVIAASLLIACSSGASASSSAPVYVHMNGGNHFLEPVVAVAPGQPVVFVNQDTGGEHTIVGFSQIAGQPAASIHGVVGAAAANGSKIPTYKVHFDHIGIYNYYCSVHAILVKSFGGTVQPAYRTGVDGYKEAMAGVIVVTHDAAVIKKNPATSTERIVPGYFGG